MNKIVFLLLSIFITQVSLSGEIIIKGNKRIERPTIEACLTFHDPKSYTEERADESVKALNATGLFSDIRINKDKSGNVIIHVVENPVINKIAFEGNEKLDDASLEKIFGSRISPRSIFRLAEIKSLTNEILKIYKVQGRFLAKVEPQKIPLPNNTVNVVFKIDEGPLALIRKIYFIGNEAFPDGTLKSQLMSAEHKWWKFWSNDDIYAPEKIELDKKELCDFYRRNGYVDMKIISAVAELSTDRKSFFLTYKIKEGVKYTVDEISIESDFKSVDKKEILGKVKQKVGRVYDLEDVQDSEFGILDTLAEKGFVFAEVESRIVRLSKGHMKLIFHISRGPKIYIGKIRVSGNTITRDTVIRREMTIEEGDPFNSVRLRESNNKIRDLDFFGNVNIEQQPGEAPDTVDLLVNVNEKPTAQIDFQIGVEIGNGLISQIGISERNFLGTGKGLSASVTFAQRSRGFSVQLVDPYFMDRKLAFMVEGGFSQIRRTKTTSYRGNSVYGGFSVGYDIAKHLSHMVGYRLSIDHTKNYRNETNIDYLKKLNKEKKAVRILLELPDPDTMTESEIKEFNDLYGSDYGSKTRGRLYSTLTYANLDSTIRPRSGYIISLTNALCGAGGNVHYNSHTLSGKYFIPLLRSLTCILKGEFGMMFGKPLIDDRFSLGGDDLKGFEYDGVGPREKFGEKYAVRGTRFYCGTAAMRMPILEGDMAVDGILFVQAGALWRSMKSKKFIFDDKRTRASIGGGIEWQSPMGPIAITYSYPIKKKSHDETQRLQIGFFVTR